MPELPDLVAYLRALDARIVGVELEGVRLQSPFLLRTVEPPLAECFGREVSGLRRLGKRIVIGLEGDLSLAIHLMVAGRLQWKEGGSKLPKRAGLAAFDFSNGSLILTEAGSKRRASLHVVRGEEGLARLDRGGLEVLECSLSAFAERLRSENHTLKRALTDPRLFSGIGNAYSDEILLRARLSPLQWTSRLSETEIETLWRSCREVLREWTDRLVAEAEEAFPKKVTAFRPEMAAHGRFGEPCPQCGAPIQRIVYAENECNYCARCQTGGRLLADRALSRLLKGDWPRTLKELEEAGPPGRS